ncbi:MAG TPA: helix-turn-helix domain-containing protein [Solirubrobacteraceae bacterium]|nr:helix-turn-helix domain-containing protein [Solirubrobacteraceae bacterium]
MSPRADSEGAARRQGGARPEGAARPAGCCPFYHEAVELIGRRWTGAIVAVLLEEAPLRFSEIAHAVPQLSDRLLSERMKELEARGVVSRTVEPGPPVRVTYDLTEMGRSLEPALRALGDWAREWLRRSGWQPQRPARADRSRPRAS